jgi:hypothetical protein
MVAAQIVVGLPPIQAIGLFIDIIGTLCIAAPDIPVLNTKLRGGRLREARAKLETSGITHIMVGFDDLLEEIAAFPDEDITEEPDYISVNEPVEGRNPENWLTVYGHYHTEGEGPMRREKLVNVPYEILRLRLREQIQKSESRIRGIGFVILALGFIIQIIGVL